MAFRATSRVTSPGDVWADGFRVDAEESGVAGRELGVAVGGGVDGPAAPRSAGVHCSGGTCHVARCHIYAMDHDVYLRYRYRVRVYTTRGALHTYHDFSKRTSPEDVADVILLFLVR